VDVWDNPYDEMHKLEVYVGGGDDNQLAKIPILLKGTVLYFDTRTPTQTEHDTLPHYHLTLENDWEPQQAQLGRRVMALSSCMDP
jgi:hypothetical protein